MASAETTQQASSETVCYCGKPMAGHPNCAACGILLGDGHLFSSVKHFNRLLCQWCYRDMERDGYIPLAHGQSQRYLLTTGEAVLLQELRERRLITYEELIQLQS